MSHCTYWNYSVCSRLYNPYIIALLKTTTLYIHQKVARRMHKAPSITISHYNPLRHIKLPPSESLIIISTKTTVQGDNIGTTSSTCRHCTLSNSIMCSDSYPISILSLFFLYHPYIPYFLIQFFFHFLMYVRNPLFY